MWTNNILLRLQKAFDVSIFQLFLCRALYMNIEGRGVCTVTMCTLAVPLCYINSLC